MLNFGKKINTHTDTFLTKKHSLLVLIIAYISIFFCGSIGNANSFQ